MLGEKIGEGKGKVTVRRVLSSSGGGPQVETSFESKGKLLGVEEKEMGTYISTMRPDGTLYGEGNGILMGKGGEVTTWIGQGMGIIKRTAELPTGVPSTTSRPRKLGGG